MTLDPEARERARRRLHRHAHHRAAEEGPAQRLDARHRGRSGPDSRGSSAAPSRCASCRRARTWRRRSPGPRPYPPAPRSRPCRKAASPWSMRWASPTPASSATSCARAWRSAAWPALVTDGVVRDLAGVLGTGLPVWCQGAAAPPSVAGLTFVDWQQPIGCGGVAVFPDDVVVVDADGAVRRSRRRWWRDVVGGLGRAGAAGGLDHGRGRGRRGAARPLSAQRREQGALRGVQARQDRAGACSGWAPVPPPGDAVVGVRSQLASFRRRSEPSTPSGRLQVERRGCGMQLRGNWNYPTSVRFGAGRIAELGEAVKAAGMTRPLLVTDPRLAAMPMVQDALDGAGRRRPCRPRVFSDIKPNPVAANVEAGLAALQRRRPRRRHRLRRRLGARCRQGDRLHGRADAPDVGLRGRRRLVDARRPQGHPPRRRRADHGRHRLRGRPRRRHHRRGDPHQEGDLPSADDAEGHDLRSRADRRHAARHHRRHRHGRAGALPGGLLRARSITRWPTASPSRACGWSRRTCRAPAATAATSRRART